MEIEINGIRSPVQTDGKRRYETFSPKSAEDIIKIQSNCNTVSMIKNIQIEEGDTPTEFVESTKGKTGASGLIEKIKRLDLELTDKESSLWSEIKANNQAMLLSFYDDNISNKISLSANELRQELKDDINDKFTSLRVTIEGMTNTVSDGTTISALEQYSNLFNSKIENLKEGQSQLKQQVDGFSRSVSDLRDRVTRITETADGIQSEVIDSVSSSVTRQLSSLYDRRIESVQGGLTSRISQLSSQIRSKVSSSEVSSMIRQSERDITLKVESKTSPSNLISSINLSKGSTRIKSSLIHLDGKSYISTGAIEDAHIKNGTITSAKIASLSANKITSGTIDALKVNVVNLNADNLSTGSISSGIFRTSFNNVNNIVTIDGSGLTVDGKWGGKIFFNNRGLTFFDKLANLEMGSIYGLYRIESDPLRRTKMGSLGVFATYGYGLALGMRNVREDSFYTFQYMTMDGPTHVIRTYANAEFHYNMKFYGGNITGLKNLQMTGRLTGATNAGYEYNYSDNGAYIRFNNGLKICWHKMGYKARSKGWEAWKFPITFDNPPTVTANLFKGRMIKGATAYPSAISEYAANITVSDTNLEYNINVMAIGF